MEDNFIVIDQRKSTKPKASVIITCYNQEKSIEAALKSLFSQSEMDFEICIGDDGSDDGSRNIILQFPVFYVRQEKKGYRKSRILNEAIRFTKSDYIILLDGDCVPHKDFVKNHLSARADNTYLAGRRIDLSEDLTLKFLNSGLSIQSFLLKNILTIHKPNRLFTIENPVLRFLFKQNKIKDLMGCNASFWKKDFIDIDGFDESFESYLHEDGDLEMRLRHSGKKIKSVKGLCLVYHLWHPRRSDSGINENRLQDTIQSKRTKAVKGFSLRENNSLKP